MNIDLKRQWRELYRSLSWRRMARDRAGSKILRFWSPIWNGCCEFFHQIDLPGIAIKAHGLTVGVFEKIQSLTNALVVRLRHIRPRTIGGALVALGMVLMLARSFRSNQEAASASAVQAVEPPRAVVVKETPAPVVVQVVDENVKLETEFAAAKQKCLDRLYATDAYKSAKAEVDRLEEQVKQLRKDDPERHLPQASQDWIAAKSVISRMTEAALNEDTSVQRTQQALLERGVLRKGKRIYVFESGQKRSTEGTDPTVSADGP